jgi:iron uptake system component EfeO
VTTPRWIPAAAAVLAAALAVTACGSSGSGSGSSAAPPGSSSGSGGPGGPGGDAKPAAVTITLTSQGCAPKPAQVTAGPVEFTVKNSDAGGVTEAELRSHDLAHILGEQENLTPGLSGGFSLTIQPGSYKISCPGAATADSDFTVTGQQAGPAWEATPTLAAAVRGYAAYVTQNTSALVSHTKQFCAAISAGNRARAKILYPQARVYYEQIEPVAEVWGSLDTQIDGRWENPVTAASQFMGFHRLEQILWKSKTLKGAAGFCSGLVTHEQQLATLVSKAQYSPLEISSGATDLINEAATAKITGEEERYSDTDFVVFEANVTAAREVVKLLQPYLATQDPAILTLIQRRDQAVQKLLAKYRARPGYDHTGFVSYAQVTRADRRTLSAAVNAYSEALSGLPAQVS